MGKKQKLIKKAFSEDYPPVPNPEIPGQVTPVVFSNAKKSMKLGSSTPVVSSITTSTPSRWTLPVWVFSIFGFLNRLEKRFFAWMQVPVPRWRPAVATILFFSIIFSFLTFGGDPTRAATYNFTQTDWSGGASGLTSGHPANGSGWDKYASKDSNITANTSVTITSPSEQESIIQTNDGTSSTGFNFTGTSMVGSEIIGSGDNASVKLSLNDATPPWTTLASTPATIDLGADLVYPSSGDYLYGFRGITTTTFYRYSISGNSWTTMAAAPATIQAGGALVSTGGDFIYAFRGGRTTTFYRYSISGNSWTTMAAAPAGTWTGAHMAYPGSGDYIYATRGDGTSTFWRYSISGDSWSELTASPGTHTAVSDLVSTGNDYLYAFNTASSSFGFYRYSISGDTWSAMANTPLATAHGSMAYPGSGDYIYATRGFAVETFYRYSISGDTWSARAISPGTLFSGSNLVSTGDNYFYITKGTSSTTFYRYNASLDSGWSTLASTPAAVSWDGGGMVYPGSGDYLYALRGGITNSFYRYSISGNSWTAMTNFPQPAYGGLSMTSTGGDYIYALVGSAGGTLFYRYSISGNSWTALADTLGPMGYGAGIIYPGSGDYLYAQGGGNANAFYRYSISGNSWTTRANVPANVFGGGSMGTNGGDYIYVVKGNNSNGFYRYSISGDSWTTLSTPSVLLNYSGIAYPGSGDYLYITTSLGAILYRYSMSGDSWSALAAPPQALGAYANGSLTYYAPTNSFYGLRGGLTSDFYRFDLTSYSSSGTYTSGIINISPSYQYGNFEFSASGGQTLTVKARTCAVSDCAGAPAFSTCTNITSGSDLSTGGCATDGHEYVQYQVTLATSNPSTTPSLDSVTIRYVTYNPDQILTSSIYDTADDANLITRLSWTATNETVSEIARLQIRSAPTSGEITSAPWCGYEDCSESTYFDSADNDDDLDSEHLLRSGANDRWFQYRIILTSGGGTPVSVSDVAVTYVVNATPDFEEAGGVVASQITDQEDDNWGKISIAYNVRDIDTDTGTISPGFITPSFEYNIGEGWLAINPVNLSENATANKVVDDSDYTEYVAYWDVKSQIPGNYTEAAQVRVTVNDNEAANNTATEESNAFALDTTNPEISLFTIDSTQNQLSLTADDDSILEYRISNNMDMTDDGSNASSGDWEETAGNSINLTPSWNLAGAPDEESVYLEVRDEYGNVSSAAAVAPSTLLGMYIKDISNVEAETFKQFVSWNVYAPGAETAFMAYELYRSTDGSSYTQVGGDITNINTNFYIDTDVNNGDTYYYKVRVIDADTDISNFSEVVSDSVDGQGGSDATAPTITSVVTAEAQATYARITWITDEVSNSRVEYSVSPSNAFGSSVAVSSYVTSHSVVLTGLTPNTTYLYRVKSTDVLENEAVEDNSGAGFSFTTSSGPIISNVTETMVNEHSATIFWNTNVDSDSFVSYSTNPTLTGPSQVGSATLVGGGGPTYQHKVTITGLTEGTTYYYFVESTDGSDNYSKDTNGGNYYSFTTTNDSKGPVISGVSAPVTSRESAVIVWQTDEVATTLVEYGEASGELTLSTELDETLSIFHIGTITGLEPDTEYFFRVTSADEAGNETVSSEDSFTTDVVAITVSAGGGGGAAVTVDTTPPTISNIKNQNITSFNANITFDTDEDSIGIVRFYPKKDKSKTSAAATTEYAKSHLISLRGLVMGTEYEYEVIVTDKSGNIATSPLQNFTTQFFTESSINIEDAEAFQKQVEEAIESALPSLVPPFIERPQILNITDSSAIIKWRTNIKSYPVVAYASDASYDATKPDPYSSEVSNTSEKASDHELVLINLQPNTKYHVQARAFSLPGVIGRGPDLTFVTKALKVQARVTDVTNSSFRAVWTTSEPTTSIVEYRNIKTGELNQKSSTVLEAGHDVLINNLTPGTQYEVVVYGFNKNNNKIEAGAPIQITTSVDTGAPEITGLKIDTALIPGRNDKTQTIVSWKTNEQSTSTVFFKEGTSAPGETLTNKVELLNDFVTDHAVVISSLKPGGLYSIQVASTDMAGNSTLFPVRTIVVPRQSESVIDIIFKNFEDTFQFLKR